MDTASLGNLARLLSLRTDTARVRTEIEGLSQELSTGRKARPDASSTGGFGALPGLQADLEKIAAYQTVAKETRTTLEAMQTALSGVQTELASLVPSALMAENVEQPALVDSAAGGARASLEALIGRMNTTVGGQSLFAGTATDGVALAPAGELLANLANEVALAGAVTAADVTAVIDAWFAPGGAFETVTYRGSAQDRAPISVSESDAVQLSQRADDPEFREALAAVAMAAILDVPGLAGVADERAALLRNAGERMLNADAGIVVTRATLGTEEQRVERSQTRLSAQTLTYELARSELLDADPFEVATRLRAAETQLDTIFTITARLSRLSLTEYLR